MDFTGERYVPTVPWPEVSYEHWHRYLWASERTSGKDVLDVACGEGYGAAWLASAAARVVGVDASTEAIRHARAAYRNGNLQFACGQAESLPFAGAAFDVVVSFETIEHLDDAAQARFVAEARRVLRPDGVFVVSTPEPAAYNAPREAPNPFHRRELAAHEFIALLRQSFRHVACWGQRVYPASSVWPLEAETPPSHEYRGMFANGRFGPAPAVPKAPMYLLALCAETPLPVAPASVLLDVTPLGQDQAAARRMGRVRRWLGRLTLRGSTAEK